MSADQPHLQPNQIQKQINLLLRDSPTICQPAQHHPGQYLLRYQTGIFHQKWQDCLGMWDIRALTHLFVCSFNHKTKKLNQTPFEIKSIFERQY